MPEDLSDQTAVVTGSSRGIGKEIAIQFGKEGANVLTTSRSLRRAEETAASIRDAGGTAVAVEVDVTDANGVDRVVSTAVDSFGQLDVMVNNAAQRVIGKSERLEPDEWRELIDVNLTGVFLGAQAAARQMISQGTGGQIVNMSSIMGEVGLQRRAAYNAAKGGVNNLTRCLAVEWAEHEIYVNALAPGYIKTDIADTELGKARMEQTGIVNEDIENRTPLGRYGTTEEMARCATFLAAGQHFITGEILHADGGWLAFGWGCRD